MKISPISITTWLHYDHMVKRIYEKNAETGVVKIVEERYPIYNNKGNLVEPTNQGSKINLWA